MSEIKAIGSFGLRVNILKHMNNSCSNGGLSSENDSCVLLPSPDFPDVHPQMFSWSFHAQVAVVKRTVMGHPYLTAYPVLEDNTIDRECSFGGTFIHVCDSRFSAISPYPIPLHDRKE